MSGGSFRLGGWWFRFLITLVQTGLFLVLLWNTKAWGTRSWCNVDYQTTDCFNEEGVKARSSNSTGLKVVMPSLGQTGTTSVILALRELGFRAYHADDFSVMAKPVMFDNVHPHLFSNTISRCRMDAISLEPVIDLLPLVYDTSPDAKFIMSWRTFPSWVKSTTQFQKRDRAFGPFQNAFTAGNRMIPWVETFDWLTGWIRAARLEGSSFHNSATPILASMYRVICNGYAWPLTHVRDRGTYKIAGSEEAYLAHINEIRVTVPRGRLLELDLTRHGFNEVEAFLGLPPSPPGRTFPRPRTAKMRTNEPLLELHPGVSVPVFLILAALHAWNWLLVTTALSLLLLLARGCRPPSAEGMRERWDEALQRSPVVVVEGLSAAQALPVGAALAEAGVRIVAVSLRDAEALESLRLLVESLSPEVVVGASAVGFPWQARVVQLEGGAFVLSSSVEARVVREAQALGLVCVAGAYTPSEAAAAVTRGAAGVAACPGDPASPERTVAQCAALPPGTLVLALPAAGKPQSAKLAELRAAGASALGATITVSKSGDAPAAAAAAARELLAACAAA